MTWEQKVSDLYKGNGPHILFCKYYGNCSNVSRTNFSLILKCPKCEYEGCGFHTMAPNTITGIGCRKCYLRIGRIFFDGLTILIQRLSGTKGSNSRILLVDYYDKNNDPLEIEKFYTQSGFWTAND